MGQEMEDELTALERQYHETALAIRRLEREQEYRDRLAAFDWALSAEDDGKSPVTSDFLKLVKQVDVDRVKQAVTEIQEKGYTIVEDVLDEAALGRLRNAMLPFYNDIADLFADFKLTRETRQTWHIQNILSKSDAVDEVVTLPILRAVVAGTLSMDYVMNAAVVAMSPDPGCNAQTLHRDDGFWSLIRRPHMPLVVTVAIALDDFTRETGGTQLVPGSSDWDARREPTSEEIVYAEAPAGSMVIWDGAVLHGGGANTSSGSRRTLTVNYARGWLRTQFNQYLSVPRERVLAMPAELQRDLGYHHSATGLGGCDHQDALSYLKRLQENGGDGAQDQLGFENMASMRGGGQAVPG